MNIGIIIVVVAVAATVIWGAWEAGWRNGHKYGRSRGWASAITIGARSPEWLKESVTQGEAILEEPRRDIRWP